jgi:hypothetical protein
MKVLVRLLVLYLLALEDLFFLSVPIGYLVVAAVIFNKLWVLITLLLPDNEYLNPADLLVMLLLMESLNKNISGLALTLLFSLTHGKRKIPLIFYLVCSHLGQLVY